MTDTASLIIKVDSSGAAKATGDLDKLAKQASRTEGAVGKAGGSMASAFKMAGGALAAIGGSAALYQIGKHALFAADQFAMMSAKLKLVTGSQQEAAAVQEKLFALSQQNRTELSATTELYVKLGQSSADLAGNSELLLNVTDRVSKALVLSGADASTASAVIRQFSQAMASGALRGDEFISLMEGAPRLMQAVAQSMGVSVGALRDLAAQGKLTREVLVDALGGVSDAAKQIDADFTQMPVTVSGAMQQMRNAIDQMIGKTDQASGSSRALAGSISDLARTLSSKETQQGFADMVSGLTSVASAAVKAINWLGQLSTTIDGKVNASAQIVMGDLAYANRYSPQQEIEKRKEAQKSLGGVLNSSRPIIGRGLVQQRATENAKRIKQLEAAQQGDLVKGAIQKSLDVAYGRKAPQGAPSKPVITPVSPITPTVKPKPSGGGRSGGAGSGAQRISEEDRATKQLDDSAKRYIESLKEQIALEGEKSNLARANYETTVGQYAKASPDLKKLIVDNAKLLDQQRAVIEVQEKARQGDEEARRERDNGVASAQRLIDDMEFELALLSMTNDQRETEIALRQAGAHATEEQRTAIRKLTEDLKNASKQAEERQDLKDLFVDIGMDIDRAGNALDAYFDKLKRRALEAMADKAIQWLMKLGQGEGEGGGQSGGGGFWQSASNFLGSIFGGGKAGGGYVQQGKTYRVNELRGEYFSPDQNGYVHNGASANSAINSNVSITVNIAQDGSQKTLSKSDGTAVANAARSVAEGAINDALRPGGRIRNAILERA